MVDRENRPIIKNENGVQKLIDVLKDFGQNDWHLASMVCQVIILNYVPRSRQQIIQYDGIKDDLDLG